jgi:CSLREA domain-containing protein
MRCRHLLLLLAGAQAARAAGPIFVVNSTDEIHDAIPGDGKCETFPGNGVCTLRAAVEEANATPDALITIPAETINLAFGDLPVSRSMTISGAGMRQTVIRATSGYRIFTVRGSATGLSLTDMTLRDANIMTEFGGAVSALYPASIDMDHVLVTNCSAASGGAVFTSGSFTISNSVFTHCHSTTSFGVGGALYIAKNATGPAHGILERCTLDTNTSASAGGAIYLEPFYGTVDLRNCTVSGNEAAASGGGISVGGGVGTFTLDHVTITDNTSTATQGGGGIYNAAAASAVSFSHSLLADNLDASGMLLADGDCAGAITSTACNILGPLGHGHCAVSGSFTAAEPLFGPLQDNGGPTPTHALLAGSPAVDFTCGALEATASDQRGVQHLGAFADLGAYERAPCGDVNGDGVVNVADVFFLINFLFAGGPLPPGLANVNQDSVRDVLDVFYLINNLFAGGPAPVCPGT